MEDAVITTDFLKEKHPHLPDKSIKSLMKYCKISDIKYQSCYGDGSIIYKKWIQSLFIK